jgi:hypothetical protein
MPVLYRGKDEYMNEEPTLKHILFATKILIIKILIIFIILFILVLTLSFHFLENKNVNNATISRVLFLPGETVYSISYLCKYSNQVISSLTLRYELGRILYDNHMIIFYLVLIKHMNHLIKQF